MLKSRPRVSSGDQDQTVDNLPNAKHSNNPMLAELLLKHSLSALGVHAISKPKQLAGVTVRRVRVPLYG